MYRIGLKLWSSNVDHYLREARWLYADGVFDYIELFVVPDTEETLCSWLQVHNEDGIPFVIHNAHSMAGFNLSEATCEKRNHEIYSQTKLFADELDARYIIFHGGVDGSIEETARQLKKFADSRTLLENKPYVPIPSPKNSKMCRGATIDEIRYVLSEVKCGFCLDVGHAVCAASFQGVEPYTYIEELAALKPMMFHLSDINDMSSPFDAHPHLGTGSLDILRLCRSVFPEDALISVETMKGSNDNLDDFVADVRFMRNMEVQK